MPSDNRTGLYSDTGSSIYLDQSALAELDQFANQLYSASAGIQLTNLQDYLNEAKAGIARAAVNHIPTVPTFRPTPVTVNGVQVDIQEPIQRAAVINVLQRSSPDIGNFDVYVADEINRITQTIAGDFPISGPTRAPAGIIADQPIQTFQPTTPATNVSLEETLPDYQPTTGEKIMSFLGDVFDTLGDIAITGVRSYLGAPTTSPALYGAPTSLVPVPAMSGEVAAIERAAGPVGLALGVTTSALSLLGGSGGSSGGISPILAQARANHRGATRRSIIQAAKHCGIDMAAKSYGLDPEQVCLLVAKGMPRRRGGISASDVRRTRSTLRKIHTIDKMMPRKTSYRRKC